MRGRCLPICALLVSSAASGADRTLEFDASVDGRPVGTHRFELREGPDGGLDVHSVAEFTYRVLGVPVYRYRHDARERWQAGCLDSLQAKTDDNGRKTAVTTTHAADTLRVESTAGAHEVTGCVRAFAYWRPEWLVAERLLNPQTGSLDRITIETLPEERLQQADGRTVAAQRRRLVGEKLRIDLWHAPDGEWLQLESLTDGRKLRYVRRLPGDQ